MVHVYGWLSVGLWMDRPSQECEGWCCCIFSASALAHGPGLWPCVSKPHSGICLFSTEWLPWMSATRGCLCQLRLAQCHLSFRKTSCVCHSGSRSFSSASLCGVRKRQPQGRGRAGGMKMLVVSWQVEMRQGYTTLCQALR